MILIRFVLLIHIHTLYPPLSMTRELQDVLNQTQDVETVYVNVSLSIVEGRKIAYTPGVQAAMLWPSKGKQQRIIAPQLYQNSLSSLLYSSFSSSVLFQNWHFYLDLDINTYPNDHGVWPQSI